MQDGENRDQADDGDSRKQDDFVPGTVRWSPRIVPEEGEESIAIPRQMAVIVIVGRGMWIARDERGGVTVALHWGGRGSAPQGGRVAELRPRSLRTESCHIYVLFRAKGREADRNLESGLAMYSVGRRGGGGDVDRGTSESVYIYGPLSIQT